MTRPSAVRGRDVYSVDDAVAAVAATNGNDIVAATAEIHGARHRDLIRHNRVKQPNFPRNRTLTDCSDGQTKDF